MRRKVLVVDDSSLVISWLRWQLGPLGYDVTSANNPLDVGIMVANTQPSIIIIDLVIPGVECNDIVANIRLHDRERKIPIIFYSGQPQARLHEASVRYNAAGYTSKKRDIAELLALLEQCTGGASSIPHETVKADIVVPLVSASWLFVDDDDVVLRSYQRFFSKKLDVDFVNSPLDALKRLHAIRPPRFVIADLVMPQMSGFDLYTRAISLDAKWSDRFVFVTGSEILRNGSASLAASVPVFPKPLSIERLQAYIEARA